MADAAVATTFEPDASSSRVEARRYNVERSCIRCHRRKTRCDRSQPCSACNKSDNADSCRYPGFERVKRRSQKRAAVTHDQQVGEPDQTVSDALKRNKHPDSNTHSPLASLSSSEQSLQKKDANLASSNFSGLLVRDGNRVRYVNDHVLSHILEREEELRSAVSSPDISLSAEMPSLAIRPLSLLHSINPALCSQDLEGVYPTQRRAIQFWQIFVLNVDPIVKVLHIPTIQPVMYAAIGELRSVKPDLRALLFAIFFSALTSISQQTIEGPSEDHQQELELFKRGMEVSLSQGNFLDQPSMYSLQAMTIFLGAFRSFGSGRSIWTMNGTVIRVAQLMGIHRDGKLFSLSPFDQEMRRRLWWRIITTDSRALEDQGIWITGNQCLGDASMPLNIDDRDIDPNTTTIPLERLGFTDSTPLVSISHIQVALEAVSQLSLCASLESYSKNLPTAQAAIARTRAELEDKLFCHYNLHIPIQRLFRDGTKMVLNKAEWRCQEGLLRHQHQSDHSDSCKEPTDSAGTEDLFKRACELLEASLELVSNEIYTSFMWHSSSYLPYQLLTFVLWRLYVNPSGSLEDDAWQIVTRTLSVIENAGISSDKGPRWNILCKLKEMVAGLRATSHMRLQNARDSPNAEIEGRINDEEFDGPTSLDAQIWDSEDLLFSTDWATFSQHLNMDGVMWP